MARLGAIPGRGRAVEGIDRGWVGATREGRDHDGAESLAASIYGSFRLNNGQSLGAGSDRVRGLGPSADTNRAAKAAKIPQCSRLFATPVDPSIEHRRRRWPRLNDPKQ